MGKTIRKRCEEFLRERYAYHGPARLTVTPEDIALYRAAYADGQRDERERAAEVIEMECYGDVGADIEGDAVKTAHNKEMVRLAGLVRQAAGEVGK